MNHNRGRYILRVIMGGYLAFIGGNLIREMMIEKPSDMTFKIFMGVLFLIVGLGYTIWTIKNVVSEMKNEMEEQKREAAAQEAVRKLEEKRKRDLMKFRTAPMPSESEIVKGTVTLKEEKEKDTEEKIEKETKKESEKDTEVDDDVTEELPIDRIKNQEDSDTKDSEDDTKETEKPEEQDFEEV